MTPSTRIRTRSSPGCGVKWMSEAPSSSAFEIDCVDEVDRRRVVVEVEDVASSSSSRSDGAALLAGTELVAVGRAARLVESGRRGADAHRHPERRAGGRRRPSRSSGRRRRRARRRPRGIDRQRAVAARERLGQKARRRLIDRECGDRRTRARAARPAPARSRAGRRIPARSGSRRAAAPAAQRPRSAVSSCSALIAPSRAGARPVRS